MSDAYVPDGLGPLLETERLLLRPHRLEDFDNYAAMWADPRVTQFISGRPFTREQSWQRFLRHPGMWRLLGFGSFTVFDKRSGAHVAEAGFHDMRRELTPSLEGTMETGWSVLPQWQGQGIATEAVGAVIGWADRVHQDKRMTCMIDPGHPASQRIARKHGFVEFARAVYLEEPVLLYERARTG